MQSEPNSAGSNDPASPQQTINCPNCRAPMPSKLRFCRSCGFRLGEGLAEYVETVRLPNAQTGRNGGSATASAQAAQTGPGTAQDWGAMARGLGQQARGQATSQLSEWKKRRPACARPSGIVWIVIAIVVFSVGGGFISVFRNQRLRINGQGMSVGPGVPAKPRSYVGSSDFRDSDKGGAYFDKITTPGGPADKAGLVGGDIITKFDGHEVKGQRDLTELMYATPIGKTVEVVYLRDGETKTTKLTTISKDDLDKLSEDFDDRKEGKGYMGIDNLDRVAIEGTNLSGIRLGKVTRNRPAYISGLREGDIIVEIEGVPIRTTGELGMRIDRAIPDSTIKVVVMRNGERKEIPVTVGID